jgi:hypothetical protein
MRIDHATAEIHDLTDSEAVELRALCERMSRGPIALDHPLIVQWATACGFGDSQLLLAACTAFPQKALYALLRREEAATAYLQEQLFATRIVTDDEP